MTNIITLLVMLTNKENCAKKESDYRILDRMLEGVQIIGWDWTYIYLNDAAIEHSKYSRKDLIGKRMMDVYPGMEDAAMFKTLQEVKSDGTPRQIENRFDFPDGSVGWFKLSIQLMPEGLFILSLDISDTKNAQIELEKQNQQTREKHKESLLHQSMLLSSQINPHFIFNALNSLQLYILNSETEPALNFTSEFSQLMRNVLNNSINEKIRLGSETHFLRLYLGLEKKRFEDRFQYEISIDEDIDDYHVAIPPMLIQPFVENAIVHGVGPLEGGGRIEVNFKRSRESLVVRIEDNGVGRTTSEKPENNTQKGDNHSSMAMTLIQNRMRILNEIDDGGYEARVEDLYNGDKPAGTLVELTIPYETV